MADKKVETSAPASKVAPTPHADPPIKDTDPAPSTLDKVKVALTGAPVKAKRPEPVRASLPPDFDWRFDVNSIPHLAAVSAAAWDAVRAPDDALFINASIDFQHTLLAHAKSALITGPQAGETAQARFEREVVKLRDVAAKKAKAAA